MVCRAFARQNSRGGADSLVLKVAVASLTDRAPLIEISTRTTNRSEPAAITGLGCVLLSVIARFRRMYVPANAAATVNGIAPDESLFSFGMVRRLVCGHPDRPVLALCRLFKGKDENLLGGVVPSHRQLLNEASDPGTLMVVRRTDFLFVFDRPQRKAIQWAAQRRSSSTPIVWTLNPSSCGCQSSRHSSSSLEPSVERELVVGGAVCAQQTSALRGIGCA